MKNGREGAFACVDSEHQYLQVGLTKREYFAAMAMQGILAGGAYYMEQSEQNGIAEDSTRLADALLSELDKPKSE